MMKEPQANKPLPDFDRKALETFLGEGRLAQIQRINGTLHEERMQAACKGRDDLEQVYVHLLQMSSLNPKREELVKLGLVKPEAPAAEETKPAAKAKAEK